MPASKETKVSFLTRPSEEATNRFVVFLSKFHTPEEIAGIFSGAMHKQFRYPLSKIIRIIEGNGVDLGILHKVLQDPLPPNERAFFLGLAHGDFSREKVLWHGVNFVAIETESERSYRRQLLRVTAGSWGEVHDLKTGVRIYLHSPTFDFMVKPKVNSHVLNAKTRFAPFLLGIIAARLSEQTNRLSLSNHGTLLNRIHDKFSKHFDHDLGNLSVEDRRNKELPVIVVKNPGQVFASLAQVESVCKLPYFRQVAALKAA